MTQDPDHNKVTCRWCGGRVLRRQLHRHFSGDCGSAPALSPDQKLCTRCQTPRRLEDFPSRSSNSQRWGSSHICKQCASQAVKEWKDANRPKATAKIRPGRWVLRPCKDCGQEFNARQMIKHTPRCPSNERRRPSLVIPELSLKMQAPGMGLDVVSLKEGAEIANKRRHKAANLRMCYGVTIEQYDALLAEQAGLCAICRRPPDGTNRRTKTLHLDHCHSSGTIRSLLCHHCNLGLGAFRDDPGLLMKAIDYLSRHRPIPAIA